MKREDFLNVFILEREIHSLIHLGGERWVNLQSLLCRKREGSIVGKKGEWDLVVVGEDVLVDEAFLNGLLNGFLGLKAKFIMITGVGEREKGVSVLKLLYDIEAKFLTVDFENGVMFIRRDKTKPTLPPKWRLNRGFEKNKKQWLNICSVEEWFMELRNKSKCLL